MRIDDYVDNYITKFNEFAYYDDNYNIGIFFAGGTNVLCCDSLDSGGVVMDREDVLDKFIVNGRPFREILPEIDETLL